jgi:energy-coupling factor transporter ATP-binding protein EcfA2
MAKISLTPPLATLGKAMGWQPLPLTVKQARRFVTRSPDTVARSTAAEQATLAGRSPALANTTRHHNRSKERQPLPAPVLAVEGLAYRYNGGVDALRDVTLSFYLGEVVAIMGRNGSGKSTLLKHLCGLLKPARGRVMLAAGPAQSPAGPTPARGPATLPLALDTRTAPTAEIIRHVGFVPQNPGTLLFKDTVLDELAFTRQGHDLPADPAADHALLARLGLAHLASHYPRDLSAGERQRVALAAILVAQPSILLLDEPTRGLDYQQKEALTRILLELRAEGRTVLLATHDVELVAQCASRVVLLAEGEVVVDGPTRDVMTGSLVFASQVNKLYRDPHYLVVQDVLGSSA